MNTVIFHGLSSFFLITHQNNFQDALAVKDFLTNEKFIPSSDIVIEKTSLPCHKQTLLAQLLGQFCIELSGDLKILKLDQKNYERIYLNY